MTVLGKRALSPAHEAREEQLQGKKCRVASFFPQNDYTGSHSMADQGMDGETMQDEMDDDEDEGCCVVVPQRQSNFPHQIQIPAYAYQNQGQSPTSTTDSFPTTPNDRDIDMDMTPQQSQKDHQSQYPPTIYPSNGPTEEEAIDMGCWYGRWQAQGGHF